MEYNQHQLAYESASLSGIVPLTSHFDRSGEAFFSPDQRWVIFRAISHGDHQYRLYLGKIVSNQGDIIGLERPICITPAHARSEGGSISPDSLSLIFSTTAGSQSPGTDRFPIDMHICRVDGWEGAISMVDATTGIDLAQHSVLADHAYNGECRYSPDGQYICFTSMRDGHPNLYVMHADGSHLVQLTKTDGYDGQASFSPDGKHLLYCSDRGSEHLDEVYLADLTFDGNGEITGLTHEHPLTYDDNVNTNPAWNPDGKHIIYATSRHGRDNYELYLMDRNGRKKTRITYSPGADLFPVFSPDGRYVMWTSKRSKDGTIQIYAARFQFPMGS